MIMALGIISMASFCIAFVAVLSLHRDEGNRITYNRVIIGIIVFLFFIAFLFGIIASQLRTEELTYKKVLVEDNPYEMIIKYELQDSVLIRSLR